MLVSQLKDLIYLPLDFETFWDTGYSLEVLTNFEYVLDPRFEIIGVSYAVGLDAAPTWVSGTLVQIKSQLAQLPWERICVVAHNARFEASILEWRLGIKPAAYLCTMVGSRPHYVPYAGGAGLEQIAAYLQLGKKGDFAKNQARGKRRAAFSLAELSAYGVYCCADTHLGGGIGARLLATLPQDEIDLIDLTIKKYVRPRLRLDRQALNIRLGVLSDEKSTRLEQLRNSYGIELSDIRSRNKFAAILAAELSKFGGEVPSKTNDKGNRTFAFSKDDIAFSTLLAHKSPKVRDLVGAKLAFGSTLEESRVTRLIALHYLTGGLLPVPLVYYGAHPGRFSGDEKINLQNLPRVVRDKGTGVLKKGHLRFAIKAPPGYKIIAADLSNIEARLVATLSKQRDLIEAFAHGADVYANFAGQIYGRPIDKNKDPTERFVGKTCILGLGYGMGWAKFQLKMAQEGIVLHEYEAKRIVYLYRSTYGMIPRLWAKVEAAATTVMTDPQGLMPTNLAGITFARERIILPNGMPIVYPGITRTANGGLGFRTRFGKSLLPDVTRDVNMQAVWGGMFTENICQALARIILVDAELALTKLGIIAAHQVHDELIFLIPEQLVAQVIPVINQIMTQAKSWLPDLPIAVEIHSGDTYGECK